MASLITTDIIRYPYGTGERVFRSHVLHPQGDITLICIISAARESIVSVVEDYFLETISSTEWKHGEEDSDFSYVTEKYNHFLTNLAVVDEETVALIFAIERGGELMVSSIGESEVILRDIDGNISNIHEDTRGHHRFELISSGEIPVGGSIFIVSKSLEGILGDTFYEDTASTVSSDFADMTSEVFAREIHETIHMVRIKRSASHRVIQDTSRDSKHRGANIALIKEYGFDMFHKIRGRIRFDSFMESIESLVESHKKIFLGVFFIMGVVIFFGLISYLLSALFSVSGSETKDAKNQILEAKTLIEDSQKLISNPASFDANIKQAEGILIGLESKQLYIKDVQEQRYKIEALKKEIYDIQSVSLDGKKSLITFDAEKIEPIGISEKEKKLTIIGKKSVIYDYVIDDTNLKIKTYPSGEIAKDYTIFDDGNFYILTESNKLIASRKNSDISYINVSGQDTWESADGIANFNNNIYLWNSSLGQIYKHKPGVNGFSNKSDVLPNLSPGIVDIAIDGGFYILKSDQKIVRFLSNNNTQTGITLNKLHGDYTIGKNPEKTKFVIRNILNYIYILDGDRLWIFIPDAKSFKDVKSWTYIAQIEISTQETIQDISVVRDGLVYILTDKGVYDLNFEFVDNNVIIRQ